MNNQFLFIDDIRNVEDIYGQTNDNWAIVRSYNEFVEYITNSGMPILISFDHDLADVLTPNEKTGYDCAQYLIEYCLNNNAVLPQYNVHSMNPVGKQNILSLLSNFKKYTQSL